MFGASLFHSRVQEGKKELYEMDSLVFLGISVRVFLRLYVEGAENVRKL